MRRPTETCAVEVAVALWVATSITTMEVDPPKIDRAIDTRCEVGEVIMVTDYCINAIVGDERITVGWHCSCSSRRIVNNTWQLCWVGENIFVASKEVWGI